jgi:predicted dehydrogenase
MRVGVVGCGYWGSKHVRVLQQLANVSHVAIIDTKVERLQLLLRSFPALRAFHDLMSALPYVDAVIVATPPRTHMPLGLEALHAGKHVLIEKPMTTDTASAQRLIEEAKAASLTLMVGHTFEYNPAVLKLREIMQSGELGRVYYIDTARLNLGIYQPDINVIWDLAPHDISIINYLLGSHPTVVQAWGSPHAHTFLEDVAYLRLHYTDARVTAQIHVSWLDPCKVRRVTVVGSKKMAVYNDVADQERLRIYDKGVEAAEQQGDFHGPNISYRYGDIFSPFIAMHEPLAVQDEHFLECVRLGERPNSDGENGLAVVKVLQAAALSLRHDMPVPVDAVVADSAAADPGLNGEQRGEGRRVGSGVDARDRSGWCAGRSSAVTLRGPDAGGG